MTLPWLKNYDSAIPASLEPYGVATLLDAVADAARTHPDAPALLFKGATITYRQLESLSDACAVAFSHLGLKRGDRLALLLPNCPQFFIAELGAWKLGAVVAPISPLYSGRELEIALTENDIGAIVTLTRYYDRVKEVQARTPLRHVIATNIKAHFPAFLRVLFTLVRERKDGDRVTARDGDPDLETLIKAQEGNRPAPISLAASNPAVLLMSGGTTGTPKGVIGTHGAYYRAGRQIEAWVSSVLGKGDSVIMLPLPMFHVYGNVGVQSLAFLTRNAIALVPNPRDIPDLLKTIRQVKPTFFNGVPSLYVALLNHPDVQGGKVDFRSIKICFSGAAPLMADTKERFEKLTGGRIVEGYSLTEGMMALCVNPVQGVNKIGSVGMPLPDVQVRIMDDADGVRQLPAGEVGEICISAPQLMVGFWNRPDETGDSLRVHHHADGPKTWLHTGDLGYMDADGYVFIVDRKKDLIKTSGNQVWPREVEEVISSHPSIAEVGVAGVPDKSKGEAVKAWVVLRPGESVDEPALRAFCRERLAPYKVPSSVEFRTELPKTLIGKVLRRALRDEHLAR